MIKVGNYAISYIVNDNKIEISLPQTELTYKSTIDNYENCYRSRFIVNLGASYFSI